MIRRQADNGNREATLTFVLPGTSYGDRVSVVGDFNGWDPMATPLRRQGNELVASVTVLNGRRYAFRYLGDDGRWFNDPEADAYEPNEFGGADGVVDLSATGSPGG